MFQKRIVLTVFAILLCVSATKAQRHSVCDNGIEFLAGITQYGFSIQPGYVRFFGERMFGKISPLYSRELDRNLYHQVLGVDAKVYYTIFVARNRLFFSPMAGLGFSSERGRWKEANFYSFHQNKFAFVVGGEAEYYINHKWSVVLEYNQHLVTDAKNSWGFHRWYLQAGIRFHFYRLHRCEPTSIYGRGYKSSPR